MLRRGGSAADPPRRTRVGPRRPERRRSAADRAGPPPGRRRWPSPHGGDSRSTRSGCRRCAGPSRRRRRSSSAARPRSRRPSTGWPRSAPPAGTARRPRWSSGSSPRPGPRPLDELWEGLPGGESFRDFHRRVVDGLAEPHRRPRHRGHVGRSSPVEPRRVRSAGRGRGPRWHQRDAVGVPARASPRCRGNGSASCRTTPRSAWSARSPSAAAHAFTLLRFGDVAHLPPELQTR